MAAVYFEEFFFPLTLANSSTRELSSCRMLNFIFVAVVSASGFCVSHQSMAASVR